MIDLHKQEEDIQYQEKTDQHQNFQEGGQENKRESINVPKHLNQCGCNT